jgi:hypothetical protein
MRKLNDLKNDTRGIFWVITIGVTVILTSDIIWVIVMLVANHFFDAFAPLATGPMTIYLGETSILMGSAVIAVINIGMIVWMAVSAFKHEDQEIPEYMLD